MARPTRKRRGAPQGKAPRPSGPGGAATATATGRLNRRDRLILGGILLAALLLRIGYLAEAADTPEFAAPAFDGAFHDYWARALASGDWSPPEGYSDPRIDDTPYFRPPAYPYLLAAVYRVAGHDYLAPRIVQTLLGLANCVLAFLLGRKVFGRGVGLLTAGLMACYWIFIYFEAELLAPVLLVLLALLLMHVLLRWTQRPTWGNTLLGGLVHGLFALARPNALILVPGVVLWAWWLGWRRKGGRRFLLPLIGYPIGLIVAIAPATIRNYAVARDAVLITSNAGVNLYIGNNEVTDCVTAEIPILSELAGLTGWTCFDQPAIARGVSQLEGRPLQASEVSDFFRRQALEYMTAHPGRVLRLAFEKALLFWGPAEISNNKEIHYERAFSGVLRFLPTFSMVLALAVAGLALLIRDLRVQGKAADHGGTDHALRLEACVLFVLFVGSYFVSFLPFFIAGRYRVPIIPFLLLFGAYGLQRIGLLAGQRRYAPAAAWLGVAVATWVVVSRPYISYTPDLGLYHYGRGVAYRKLDRMDLAIDEFRRAIEATPRPSPLAYNNLGAALADRNQLEPAIAAFRTALEINPDYFEAHQNLATALVRQKRVPAALPSFQQMARIRPDDLEARYNSGTILLGQQQYQQAVVHLTEAVRIQPDHFWAHYNLAKALTGLGRTDEALTRYLQAIRINPDLVPARLAAARLLAARGDRDAALEQLQEVLRREPQNTAARQLLGQMQSP